MKPADKDEDAELAATHARHAAIRARVTAIRESLAIWIKKNSDADDVTISMAMLETAIDRYIDLHGVTEAHETVQASFRSRTKAFRRRADIEAAANRAQRFH